MTVQRFSGFAWQCPVRSCRRKIKAASVLVLEQRVEEHVDECRAKVRADIQRAIAAAVQGELFK